MDNANPHPYSVVEGTVPFTHPRLPITCETYYKAIGDFRSRRPLVVVHGGAGGIHDYLVPCLQDFPVQLGIPVVYYDQVGNGQSTHLRHTKNDESVWRIDLFVAELENLISRLEIPEYDLLGHSWGGCVASEFALQKKPPGLRRLVLASAPTSMALKMQAIDRHLQNCSPETWEAAQRARGSAEFSTPAFRSAMTRFARKHMCNLRPWPDALVAFLRAVVEDDTVSRTVQGESALSRTGSERDWSMVDRCVGIGNPTLVITGEGDFVRPEGFDAWSNIRGSQVVLIEGATHMSHLEKPAVFTKHLTRFLTD
jgi:L-proline amide hydrolase